MTHINCIQACIHLTCNAVLEEFTSLLHTKIPYITQSLCLRHSCYAAVMLQAKQPLFLADIHEFQQGLLSHMVHDHQSSRHHRGWEAAIVLSSCAMMFCLIKRAKHRRGKKRQKSVGIASQLSELSAKSSADTMPNPLLHGPMALAVHDADIIPRSDPDWMQNVPWSDWQIDQEDITICRRPDGRLWELGSGASAKVC